MTQDTLISTPRSPGRHFCRRREKERNFSWRKEPGDGTRANLAQAGQLLARLVGGALGCGVFNFLCWASNTEYQCSLGPIPDTPAASDFAEAGASFP